MTAPPSITCPQCNYTSYSVSDIRHRYCGHCHQHHKDMACEQCGCGQLLHYNDPEMEQEIRALVAKHGVTIAVQVADQSHGYLVPRHYIAKHGLKAAELEELATRYGWEKA